MIKIAFNLSLPLDLVTESIGILAIKRVGKSYLAQKIVEQLLHTKQQVVVTDPKGDWWGLRAGADGDPRGGFPILILGGEHGDLPLEVNAGETIARQVVEDRISVILDLSNFRKSQIPTFMALFLETIYRLKAKEQYRTPVMIAIDEADAIAPQRPDAGEARMLGAAEDIVRRGGQRGIGIMMVTQRAAVLNKNVLTQMGILFILRTISPQDRAAMAEWYKINGTPEQIEKLNSSIASLQKGEAWVWSPGWPTEAGLFKQIQVLPKETFDSGATPKAGQVIRPPKSLAEVDLEALKSSMAATIEKAKAEDPKELRRQIADLNRKIEVLQKEKPVPNVETVEVPVLKEGEIQELEAIVNKFVFAAREAQESTTRMLTMLHSIKRPSVPPRPQIANVISKKIPPASKPLTPRDEGIAPVQQRILNALGELEQLGAQTPPREMVAFLSGYTNLNSKGFVNGIGALHSAGLVDYPSGGLIALTDAGRQAAVYADAPRSPKEVQERVIRMLGGASSKILEPLIQAYPNAIPRDQVAAAAGYGNLNSKGFVNALGRLRTLGFLDYPSSGMVKAAPILFLEI